MQNITQRIQGIVSSVYIFDNGISRIDMDSIGEGRQIGFLFYRELDRDLAGSVIDFKDILVFGEFCPNAQRVQVLDIGGGTLGYVATISQKNSKIKRQEAYRSDPEFMRRKGLTIIG